MAAITWQEEEGEEVGAGAGVGEDMVNVVSLLSSFLCLG